jgi:glycosyltransferase involved in cell wall biosynthesis
MAAQFREAGITVHELGVRRGVPDPRAVLRLRKIIRSFRPTVIHSHMVHANLLARVTRLVCPMPALLCTAHNIIEGGRWTEIAYRLTDPLGDLTTIICDAAAQRCVQVNSVPRNRLKVVVNGFPIEQFRPDPQRRVVTRQQLGIWDEFVWLAVGRFETQKDYCNLVNAVTRLPSQESLFLIAGDGPLRPEIERLAMGANVLDRFRFLGMRKDVPALMAAADGYVMPSAWEGLPMVLLEAAGSGLPIVATNVGGNSEIVRDDVSGYLVPPSNPTALAEALQKMEDALPSSRAAMGSAGRAFVIQKYSLSSVLDEWECVYGSLMQKPSQLIHAHRGAD